MKIQDRRNELLEYIKKHGEVTIDRLKLAFSGISEMTLRRDLDALDQNKQIVRIYGGARSIGAIVGVSEESFGKRPPINSEAKDEIGRKAVELLKANTCVFLDSGATATAFARNLPDENYLIYTRGITCAMELTALNKPVVYMIGGRLDSHSISTRGSQITTQLGNINFDCAILGAAGFTMETGFTVSVFDDCELKRFVMSKAQKKILLIDSSKVGKVMPYTFAMPKDIDIVISDSGMDSAIARQLEEQEVRVL